MDALNLTDTKEKIADICSDIAKEAGNKILDFFTSRKINISTKSDRSPFSEADLISHSYITECLQKTFPKTPIVSEENKNFFVQPTDVFWLVDPLDGTRDFIEGRETFTVNIALIQNNAPVIGVICAPALGACYKAVRSEKAYKKTDGAWQEIHTKEPLDEAVIVCSRDHGYKLSEDWARKNLPAYKIHKLGSSLKFCLIAEGKAHFYPRFQPTRQWDTAAGEVIVKAAGGNVATFDGKSIFYNGLSLANPDFLACWKKSDPDI